MSIWVEMPALFTGSFNLKNPHCTLMWLGENLPIRQRDTIETAVNRLRTQVHPQMVPTTDLAVFAKGTCTVIKLKVEVLATWRTFLEKELRREGIISQSTFGFSPHVTINKHTVSSQPILPWEDFRMPATIWLDKPRLQWHTD